MNNTPPVVEETLRSIPAYVDKFKIAFPNEAQPVTFDNLAKAIEAFEATLITPASRFDQFLEGNMHALNDRRNRACVCSWIKAASPATRVSMSAARNITRLVSYRSPARKFCRRKTVAGLR